MRTTLDLPDETFRHLKAEAALRGTKLKDLITEFIEKGLAAKALEPHGEAGLRSPLPVFRPATGITHPALSNAEIEELLSLEDRDARP
jgi:hypothetical protein